jgi:hypothetical protein
MIQHRGCAPPPRSGSRAPSAPGRPAGAPDWNNEIHRVFDAGRRQHLPVHFAGPKNVLSRNLPAVDSLVADGRDAWVLRAQLEVFRRPSTDARFYRFIGRRWLGRGSAPGLAVCGVNQAQRAGASITQTVAVPRPSMRAPQDVAPRRDPSAKVSSPRGPIERRDVLYSGGGSELRGTRP